MLREKRWFSFFFYDARFVIGEDHVPIFSEELKGKGDQFLCVLVSDFLYRNKRRNRLSA
jgi:hypothetical protein